MISKVTSPPEIRQSKHGLVATGNVVESSGGEWENGVTFTPQGCYPVAATVAACPPAAKTALKDCVAAAVFVPYVLEVGIQWSTMDRGMDAKDMARQTLEAGTSSALEALLWATAPGLTLADAADVGNGGTPANALGAVESALISNAELGAPHTGGWGTIYMSPMTAAQLDWQLEDYDGRLQTRACGHQVVVGNFWPATKIIGHIGQVDVYLGDIFVVDANDVGSKTNEVLTRAERLAMAVWNPCALFSSPTAGP